MQPAPFCSRTLGSLTSFLNRRRATEMRKHGARFGTFGRLAAMPVSVLDGAVRPSAATLVAFNSNSIRSRSIMDRHRRWLSSTTTTNNNNNNKSWNDKVSKRDFAELEDFLCQTVEEKVQDPVLHQPLSKLKWLHRKIAISNGDKATTATTLQLLLRLPSLLHPSLDELKSRIRKEAESAVQEWLQKKSLLSAGLNVCVNVEAIATAPVPMMARLVEDHEDMIKSLGPGLKSVAHFVAVYSCKVRVCCCTRRPLYLSFLLIHPLFLLLCAKYFSVGRCGQIDRGGEFGVPIGSSRRSCGIVGSRSLRAFVTHSCPDGRHCHSSLTAWSGSGFSD